MKLLSRLTILGLMGALVAACSSIDLNATKKMSLSGDAFQNALFKEYVDLARMEDEEFDSADAVYFDNRAKAAAAGKDTGPQELSARNLPKSAMGDLKDARDRLMKVLGGASKSNPAQAARAQAMFDCWMQEQEENDQPKDIAACRDGFEAAMKGLSAKKPEKKKAKKAPEPINFVVFFDFNKADLSGDAVNTVYDIMASSDGGRRVIILTGHADTSGNKAYNRKLSEKRVGAVAKLLGEIGIPDDKILTQHFGEDEPAVKTGDGVKNANNRRVNVTIK